MRKHNVDSLVVLDDEGRLEGLVTVENLRAVAIKNTSRKLARWK